MVMIPPSEIISLQLRKEEIGILMYNKNMQLQIRTYNVTTDN